MSKAKENHADLIVQQMAALAAALGIDQRQVAASCMKYAIAVAENHHR